MAVASTNIPATLLPIRVDHVPTVAGEDVKNAGYDALGRLYAIGYLKGFLEGLEN